MSLDTQSPYNLDRFMAAPSAAFRQEWLDDQGMTVGGRHAAVQVRMAKRLGNGIITVRLDIADAVRRGLLRPENAQEAIGALIHDESGASAAEYALVLALIGLVITVSVTHLGAAINTIFSGAAKSV